MTHIYNKAKLDTFFNSLQIVIAFRNGFQFWITLPLWYDLLYALIKLVPSEIYSESELKSMNQWTNKVIWIGINDHNGCKQGFKSFSIFFQFMKNLYIKKIVSPLVFRNSLTKNKILSILSICLIQNLYYKLNNKLKYKIFASISKNEKGKVWNVFIN